AERATLRAGRRPGARADRPAPADGALPAEGACVRRAGRMPQNAMRPECIPTCPPRHVFCSIGPNAAARGCTRNGRDAVACGGPRAETVAKECPEDVEVSQGND